MLSRMDRPRCAQVEAGSSKQVIMADLNTMANGVARLSPNYCCDALRFGSLGLSEAQWWHRHVLAVRSDAPNPPPNRTLMRWGLDERTASELVNPGFHDPFDVRRDITLDNPKYRALGCSLMTGKLDWVLLRGMSVVARSMGNHDFSASDHKWLQVTVR